MSLLGGWCVRNTIGTQVLEAYSTGIVVAPEYCTCIASSLQLLTRLAVWLDVDSDVSVLYGYILTVTMVT